MVLHKDRSPSGVEISKTMSNEQPVSKRQKIENISSNNSSNNSSSSSSSHQEPPTSSSTSLDNTTDLSALNASLNTLTTPTTSSSLSTATTLLLNNNNNTNGSVRQQSGLDELDNIAIIGQCQQQQQQSQATNISNKSGDYRNIVSSHKSNDLQIFQDFLMKQCLCAISERTLARPFQSYYTNVQQHSTNNHLQRIATLTEWPCNRLLQFLSNLQLLLDVYLKQNTTGHICQRIMDVCTTLIQNGHTLIDEIIDLCDYNNKYVQFLAGKVMTSFLVVAKDQMNNDWLEKLVNNLFMFEHINYDSVRKISFSLDIFKRIIEWKDIDLHPLDQTYIDTDENGDNIITPPIENNYFAGQLLTTEYGMSSSSNSNNRQTNISSTTNTIMQNTSHFSNYNHHNNIRQTQIINRAECSPLTYSNDDPLIIQNTIHNVDNANDSDDSEDDRTNYCTFAPPLKDSESFDTTCLKLDTVKMLENKWSALVRNMSILITTYRDIEYGESTILTFLSLWESIISVQANLSVVQTLPFHAQLYTVELLLNRNLSPTIYKQMLTLFNEALCYGSTLALQDGVPQEARCLANQIVRHVRDVRDNPPISFPILQTIPIQRPQNRLGLIGYSGVSIVYEDDSFRRPSIVNGNDAAAAVVNDEMLPYVDKTLLQKMVLLILKSIAVTVKEVRGDSSDSSIDSSDNQAIQDMVHIESSIRDAMEKLETFIKATLEFHPGTHFSKILVYLFDDQDDYLIESMVCTLDVTSILSFRHNPFPELVQMLNPIYTFLEFLKMISNSSDLLLDLLVSNETCFLLYLLRFLKYIRVNWCMFVASCQHFDGGSSGNLLDDAMAVLIRLRLQISRLVSRSLYPYDISPVLRLLESCECLYEGNELS